MGPIWAIDEITLQAYLNAGLLRRHAMGDVPWPEPAEHQAGAEASTVEQAKRDRLPIQTDGTTAIVSMTGPMMKNPGWILQRIFGFCSTRDVAAALQAAAQDEQIRNIVLRIDSPGGTVDGTAELGDTVRQVGAIKPVIAQVDGMCASAAYWVASQASKIQAGRNDLAGSIGARMMVYDFSGLFEQAGIKALAIDTGEFKSVGAEGTEVTERHQEYLQGLIDSLFEDFSTAVKSGRGMNEKQFKAVADGRMFVATTARDMGLIDGIRTMDETIGAFRQQAARRARLQRAKQA